MNKATEHGPYTYNYDSLYRLAGAVSPVLPQESFSYDPVGNRLTSATANNWSYNQNNELQSYNGVTFQYDLNGNTTKKIDNGTIQNFLYNEDDRLTEVKDGAGALVATYYYDPFGRRLWKEVGGATTYFMYADEGLITEFDGTGYEIKSYGYAPNSAWTTNPLFMEQGTQYYFYHNDHLGTPQKMTSVRGAVAWSSKYESFGKAVIDSFSTIENNLRFPGQYYDAETSLHYNYHRYYDPRTTRYLIADPKGVEAGLNLYSYVSNNPIFIGDPQGLCEWSGTYTYGGISARIYGAGLSKIKVKSKCCNGRRSEATCNIIAGGFTLGPPTYVQFGHASISRMIGPETPSYTDPQGAFSYFSGTVALPFIGGRSSSAIGCGKLYTVETGSVSGFDIGVDAFAGYANCWGRDECCDNDFDD